MKEVRHVSLRQPIRVRLQPPPIPQSRQLALKHTMPRQSIRSNPGRKLPLLKRELHLLVVLTRDVRLRNT